MDHSEFIYDKDLIELELEYQDKKRDMLKDIDVRVPNRRINMDLRSQIETAFDKMNSIISQTYKEQNHDGTKKEIQVVFSSYILINF